MKNKRGLSQVVTTIILILLIIMAIGGIWLVVNKLIIQGSNKINLEQFTIDLKIVSAKINYSSGIAEVKVKRNQGEGNLTAIKFIVEDSKTSEVFEEKFTRFEELAEKTFNLNLLITGSDLIISEIEKISIAPVYIIGSGTTTKLGNIIDTISGLKNLNPGSEEISEGDAEPGEDCTINLDCGTDYFIEGTKICNALSNTVLQYKKIFTCSLGFCDNENVLTPLESCPIGYTCFDGNCLAQKIPCTNETMTTDCGINNWVGPPGCQSNPEAIVQNFKTYTCDNNFCNSYTNLLLKETCIENEICYEGNCFEALECANNEDCMKGYICKEGECFVEEVMNKGTIRSEWPYGIGEYFDSVNLPQNDSLGIKFRYIIFPGSSQIGCLQIKEFVFSTFEGGISYIRLNTAPTNISAGNNYEIWETDYVCSL